MERFFEIIAYVQAIGVIFFFLGFMTAGEPDEVLEEGQPALSFIMGNFGLVMMSAGAAATLLVPFVGSLFGGY